MRGILFIHHGGLQCFEQKDLPHLYKKPKISLERSLE